MKVEILFSTMSSRKRRFVVCDDDTAETSETSDSSRSTSGETEDAENAEESKEDKKVVMKKIKITKHKNHSITKDLTLLNLPNDVRQTADDICRQLVQGTHRNRKRKYLVFFCVYEAYKKLGQPKDPYILARLIGFETNSIQAAFSLFSSAKTGYTPEKRYETIYDLLPSFCSSLGIDADAVKTLAESIIKKDPCLEERIPRTLAAGIIKYFIKINGIQISDSKIAEVCDRTVTSITSMLNKVCQVDNTI